MCEQSRGMYELTLTILKVFAIVIICCTLINEVILTLTFNSIMNCSSQEEINKKNKYMHKTLIHS